MFLQNKEIIIFIIFFASASFWVSFCICDKVAAQGVFAVVITNTCWWMQVLLN